MRQGGGLHHVYRKVLNGFNVTSASTRCLHPETPAVRSLILCKSAKGSTAVLRKSLALRSLLVEWDYMVGMCRH